jgi:hypothetical protein
MAITSSFANLATVTRASKKTDAGGWDFTNGGTVGTLTEYAAGVAALEPTAGLRIEKGTTNEIRNPRFEGGTAGTLGSGGVLPTNFFDIGNRLAGVGAVLSFGSSGGREYMEIAISGTPTADLSLGLESSTQVSAADGENWTLAFDFVVVSGSFTNIDALTLNIIERTSVGGYVKATGTADLKSLVDGNERRIFGTFTLSGGGTVAAAQPTIALEHSSGAVAITYRIYAPQLEQKAYPTSPVFPTAASPAASTRAADSVVIANGSWSNDDAAGTIFVEFAFTHDGQASDSPRVLGYGADSSNRVDIYRDQAAESLFALLSDGGATQASLTNGTAPAATTKKVAVAWAADDVAFSVSGGTQQTDSSATIGFGAAVLRLGAGAGNTNASDGLDIKDMRYFPRRLSNAELEALVGN